MYVSFSLELPYWDNYKAYTYINGLKQQKKKYSDSIYLQNNWLILAMNIQVKWF